MNKTKKIYDILKRMIWLIKQFLIIRALNKFIWKEHHIETPDFSFDSNIKRKGAPQRDFLNWLYKKKGYATERNSLREFWVFSRKDFFNKNEAIIRDCIINKYIDVPVKISEINDYTPLTISPKGNSLISVFGFIQEIGKNFDKTWTFIIWIISILIALNWNNIWNTIKFYIK